MYARPLFVTALSAAAASVLLSGCGVGEAKVLETAAEVAPIPVAVAEAEIRSIEALYSATTALEADAEAPAVARTQGELIRIYIEEGDYVEAGQILARLDGARQRLAVEQARANRNKVQQEYDRNVELHQRGLVSAGAFENIKYEVDALHAAYELARLDLSYTEIRAPISGVVSERLVKLGNSVTDNNVLFRIADPNTLVAHVYVPQRELHKFQIDQPAILNADALPGDSYAGRILRISPTVDASNGTFKVTLEIAEPQHSLMPGMFTRVGIVYDRHDDALTVPAAAILDEDSVKSLFVVEEGVARRVNVETGFTTGDRIEILSGLDSNAKVVVIGQNGLKDGSRVIEAQATSI